jgi:phosphotransferase system HPr-like phosphotransfer protein
MGEEIELCCEGEDEEEAMNRLSELVENGFQS